ncbi:unnamed protein product [Pedinophyceae sp. YPF-701]|nr:unnamed protein product [Pedinophyceae sp. YPF-701]
MSGQGAMATSSPSTEMRRRRAQTTGQRKRSEAEDDCIRDLPEFKPGTTAFDKCMRFLAKYSGSTPPPPRESLLSLALADSGHAPRAAPAAHEPALACISPVAALRHSSNASSDTVACAALASADIDRDVSAGLDAEPTLEWDVDALRVEDLVRLSRPRASLSGAAKPMQRARELPPRESFGSAAVADVTQGRGPAPRVRAQSIPAPIVAGRAPRVWSDPRCALALLRDRLARTVRVTRESRSIAVYAALFAWVVYLAFGAAAAPVALVAALMHLVSVQEDRNVVLRIVPERCLPALRDGRGYVETHPQVACLFADLVGYTRMCSSVAPAHVLCLLDEIYHQFDQLCHAAGAQKAETIGDGYVAVAGLGDIGEEDAARAVKAAVRLGINMIRLVDMYENDGEPLNLRVGVHVGPVAAGIMGQQVPKFSFIGDTFNVASRMESSGVPGTVQLSAEAHRLYMAPAQLPGIDNSRLLPAERRVDAQGLPIVVKGKGRMQTYLVRVPDLRRPRSVSVSGTVSPAPLRKRRNVQEIVQDWTHRLGQDRSALERA